MISAGGGSSLFHSETAGEFETPFLSVEPQYILEACKNELHQETKHIPGGPGGPEKHPKGFQKKVLKLQRPARNISGFQIAVFDYSLYLSCIILPYFTILA